MNGIIIFLGAAAILIIYWPAIVRALTKWDSTPPPSIKDIARYASVFPDIEHEIRRYEKAQLDALRNSPLDGIEMNQNLGTIEFRPLLPSTHEQAVWISIVAFIDAHTTMCPDCRSLPQFMQDIDQLSSRTVFLACNCRRAPYKAALHYGIDPSIVVQRLVNSWNEFVAHKSVL